MIVILQQTSSARHPNQESCGRPLDRSATARQIGNARQIAIKEPSMPQIVRMERIVYSELHAQLPRPLYVAEYAAMWTENEP